MALAKAASQDRATLRDKLFDGVGQLLEVVTVHPVEPVFSFGPDAYQVHPPEYRQVHGYVGLGPF